MKTNFRLFITFLMLLGLGLSQSAWGETVRIYCKTPSWWNTDGAGCSVHYWGGTSQTGWPGARMSQVSGTSDVWYIDVDKANLTNLKFARVTGSGTLSYLSAQTGNLTLDSDAGKRLYTISNSSGCWDSDKCTCSGSWGKYAPTGAVCGGWNSWNPATDPFINGVANITLTAGTTQYFKVMLGSTYYGNNGTMTIDNCTGWTMSTSGGNCGITTYGAGSYQFVYNSSTSKLTVYYPYFVSSHGASGSLPDLTGTPGKYQFTCNNGIYSKTCNNASAGAKVYRITRKDAWESSWEGGHHPDNSQSTSNITVTESSSTNRTFTTAKVSNITIYFNPSTMKTWVNATPVNLITYDANGANSGTVPVDDAASIKVKGNSGNLAKNGYTFSGWNTAANGSGTHYDVNADFNPSSSTTLYAEWTPTNYTITYKDKDNADFSGTWGSGSHPDSYNIETATITLDQPTKSGYRFDGWFTAQDCSGSAVTQITIGSTGNKTFYAKWTKYAPNGAIIGSWNSWKPATDTLKDGSVTINLTANATPYEFKVLYGTDYYGNNGTMYRNNCSGWTMETGKNNCKILADKTGDYVFAWNNSTKKLSVTYAESSTRTIYLDYSNFTDWASGTSGFKVGDYNGADKQMTKVNDCGNDYLYSAQVGTIDINYVFKRISKNTGKALDSAFVVVTGSNNACKITGWKAGSASTITRNYTVKFNKNGHGADVADRCITDGQSTTDPGLTESGYICEGWFTNSELTNQFVFGTTTITAPTTLYAKWTEPKYTVSVAVNNANMGQVNVASVTDVGAVTKSASITATPKAGCYFTGWTIPDGVTLAEGTAASTTIKINATADSKTITANFAGRYAFRGSLNESGGPQGGMPGWSNETPVAFNDVHDGQGHVTYTLEANKTYKFKLRDMTQNKYAGFATSGQYLAINGTYFTQLDGESGQDVLFTTRGAGNYEFLFGFNSYTPTAYCTPKVKSVVAFTSFQIPFGVNDANMGAVTATANDVAFTNNQYVAQGDNVVFTATPNTGYEVEGWYTDAACTQGKHDAGATTYTINSIAAAATVYVKFQPQSYAITYKDQGDVAYSGSNLASLPTTHTYDMQTTLVAGAKAGYSFDGWFEDAACEGTVVTSIGANTKTAAFTLYAKWTQSLVYYAITKGVNDANMGSVSSNAADESSVLAGTEVTFTATPNAGYEVEGWYTNAECTEGKSDEGQLTHKVTMDANKTVYVKFKYIDYTVTMVANKPAGCSPTIGEITTAQDLTKVHHGVSFSITATPTVLSRFMGWTSSDDSKVTFENANSATTNVTVTGNNVTIYANFDGRYALRGGYKDKSGEGGMPGLLNTTPIYGTTYGYEIRTLDANTNYVFYVVDLADDNKMYGMNDGWINLESNNFTTFVYGKVSYIATRGAGKYKFELCATTEGTIYPRMKVYKGTTNPASLQMTFGQNGEGSVSATAKHGSAAAVAITTGQWVATGDTVVFTAAPNTGYEVEGWYTNSACTEGKHDAGATTYTINNIQSAQTVYVKFKGSTYTINYKDQDDAEFSGEHVSGYPTTHTYGTATELKTATKTGYVFEGWYADAACTGTAVTSLGATAYTGDITLYAKWRTAEVITVFYYNRYDWNGVRYMAYDGTAPGTGWPGPLAALTDTTHDGHTIYRVTFYEGEYNKIQFSEDGHSTNQTARMFNVTDNNGKCVIFDKTVKPDSCWWGTLPTQNYLVTFDVQGHGTAPAAVWVDKDAKVTAPAAPSATGYTFGGWYKEAGCTTGQEWSFDTPITATTTIYAKWTPIQYTITYNTNGGEAVEPGSYTIETPTFSLPTTTKTGAVFDGWYSNSGLTGIAITQIAQGSTGDTTFWAKWESKHAYLEGRARVKTGADTYIKVSDSGSEWATDSKNIEFTYNSTDGVYYLNLNQTVGEVEAYTVNNQHHYFRVGIADGDEGDVTCLGVTNVENDYEFTTAHTSATLLTTANKSAWFNPANAQAPNTLAGPVMLKYDPTNLQLAYCAPLLTFSYSGNLNTMRDYAIALDDASATPTGLTDAAITYQYKLDDGEWQIWSGDIAAAEGTYTLRATASGNNEFGQAVSGVVSNEITVTVTTPAISAQVTHVNDVATDNPIVRVNDNFTITPTVTNVPDDQTIQVCYKWITVPAGSAIDKSKNIFTQVGETSAAKVAIDVAGDYQIRVLVTSSAICPDLGIKWDSTDVNVHVKGDEITVYAKVDKGITDWNNKYIYYWKGDAKAKAWPGHEMAYIGKDSTDYEWYSYNIVGYKAYQGGNLLFNDGTEQYGQYQTNNVNMPDDDEFYFIKTAIDGGKRNVATDPHIDVTRRVILLTDTTALYQYVTIKLEGKGIFFANREDMTYTYTLTSRPEGSAAALNQKHQLTPDMAGDYVVTIRCTAGSLNAENTFILRVQPNPVTLTASAGASAEIGATTTLTVASSQPIDGLNKTFTVIEPGTNDPITFQSGTTEATSSAYTLRSSGTYTFSVVLTDNDGVIAGKAQCTLSVNPKGIWLSQNNQAWTQMTYSESDGVYKNSTLTFYTGHDAYLSKDNKEWHMAVLNPDNIASGSACVWVYDVTTDQVTVYSLNKRLYRIKSICDDNTYYSNAITDDGESISFFAEKGGTLMWQTRETAAAEWIDGTTVTTAVPSNGIYTATPNKLQTDFALTAYTGTLTVFSQLTKDAISTGSPTAANGQLTEFTKASAAEYFNHYWARYISTNNAQAMATVGNSINNCLATTLPYYEMPANANVRYAYDNTTNHFSRAFLAGSDDQNFLRVYGEHLDTLVAGSDPKQYTPISSLESSKKFDDGSDWIYTASASGDVNSTQSVTAKLVTTYNNTQRWILAESGLEADEDAKKIVLNQDVATPGRYNLTLIYDFKTNRLTAGAQPEPGTVIKDTMLVDQLILSREGDGDATQFSLTDDAKLIVVDKMTVELEVTKKMWTEWEDTKTGGGYKIMYFWFSVPFACRISDIYGLGVYGTKFEIQRYRGDLRALGQAGGGQTASAWRKLKATATMEANRGYVVALRVCESDFKSAGDNEIVRLFFPSIGKVELKHEVTTILAENESDKTSNLHWNWNIMGNPLATSGEGLIVDTPESAELNYVYQWTWGGGARTYEPWAVEDIVLKSTHGYMVQGKGTVYWKYPSADPAPMRYLEAAHYASDDSYGKLNLRLNIQQDEQLVDKTYIRYREDGDREQYEMGRDLEKIINSGVTQMYATTDNNLAAICLNSEDKDMIPLTVIANKNGQYTIALHRSLNSNLEPTIYDAETGTYTNLSLSNFIIDLTKGTYANRFYFLLKKTGVITNMGELNSNNFGNGVQKIIMNEQLYIIRDGAVYDAKGILRK